MSKWRKARKIPCAEIGQFSENALKKNIKKIYTIESDPMPPSISELPVPSTGGTLRSLKRHTDEDSES